MRLGTTTGLFFNQNTTLLEDIRKIIGNGFEAIEIVPKSVSDLVITPELKKLLRNVKSVSVHPPTPIVQKDGNISDNCHEWYKHFLDFAASIKAEIIVIHPEIAVNSGTPYFEYKLIKNLIEELAISSELLDLRITIENMSNCSIAPFKTSDEIKFFLKELNNKNIGITLDVSHAYTVSKQNCMGLINEMQNLIDNVHISDTKGNIDHFPIGMGEINFQEVLKLLKDVGYTKNIIIETTRMPNLKNLKKSRESLERIINNFF